MIWFKFSTQAYVSGGQYKLIVSELNLGRADMNSKEGASVSEAEFQRGIQRRHFGGHQ